MPEAAPPSLTAALNASGLFLNASLAFGNGSAFESHDFASGLLQTLLAQLPSGAHLLDAGRGAPACPAARNASLDQLLPPCGQLGPSTPLTPLTPPTPAHHRHRSTPPTLDTLDTSTPSEHPGCQDRH